MSGRKKMKQMRQKSFSKKQIELFKKDLGLDSETVKNLKCIDDPNKGEPVNRHSGKKGWTATDIIVYRDPPKRKTRAKNFTETQATDHLNDPRTNLNNLRREVHSFALKGFNKTKQKDLRIRQLIKLGAKPPKNKSMTIKELKEKRFHEKQLERQSKMLEKDQGHKISSTSAGTMKKNRSKKDRNDIGGLEGQIGRHKRGITKLSKRDISGVSKRNKRK